MLCGGEAYKAFELFCGDLFAFLFLNGGVSPVRLCLFDLFRLFCLESWEGLNSSIMGSVGVPPEDDDELSLSAEAEYEHSSMVSLAGSDCGVASCCSAARGSSSSSECTGALLCDAKVSVSLRGRAGGLVGRDAVPRREESFLAVGDDKGVFSVVIPVSTGKVCLSIGGGEVLGVLSCWLMVFLELFRSCLLCWMSSSSCLVNLGFV